MMKLPVFDITIRRRRPKNNSNHDHNNNSNTYNQNNNRPGTAMTQESEVSNLTTDQFDFRPTSSCSDISYGTSPSTAVVQQRVSQGMISNLPSDVDTTGNGGGDGNGDGRTSVLDTSMRSGTNNGRRPAATRFSSQLQQFGFAFGKSFQNSRFMSTAGGNEGGGGPEENPSPRRLFGTRVNGRSFRNSNNNNNNNSMIRSSSNRVPDSPDRSTLNFTSVQFVSETEDDNLSNCNSSDSSTTLPVHAVSLSPSSILQFTLPSFTSSSAHQSSLLSTTRCFCTLRLRHTGQTKSYVAYKVKTTQPKRYRVQPNHCGILSPGMSTTVTIRLLEKYKNTLVQNHRRRRDGVAVTSEEDKFFVQSCVVDDALSMGMVEGGGGSKNGFQSISVSNHGTKPKSDERMDVIWRNAKNNPDKVKVFKRKLLVQHIYPGVVDVLETTPTDVLEFILPYDPEEFGTNGGIGGNDQRSPRNSKTPMPYDHCIQNRTISEDEGDTDQININPNEDEETSQSIKIPRCVLTLTHTNETMDHILFKIKTNRPGRYRVHPDHQGLLSPGDSKMVSIRLLEKHRSSLLLGFACKRPRGVVVGAGGAGGGFQVPLGSNATPDVVVTSDPENNPNGTDEGTRREELKTDDRFFIQYCTVDDAFLREWPNLNSEGITMTDIDEDDCQPGIESNRSDQGAGIAGAMSGMWAAAERSKSVHVIQRRFPVRHVVEWDGNYARGGKSRFSLQTVSDDDADDDADENERMVMDQEMEDVDKSVESNQLVSPLSLAVEKDGDSTLDSNDMA